MIDKSQPINNSENNTTSIAQEIDMDIQEALTLLDIVKKQDSQTIEKELNTLLVEYILANMKGDLTEAETIQGQIDQVMQTYGKGMQQANELGEKLKAMEANSSNNSAKDLAYLQSLIAALKQDAGSGDMSNLYQY